MPPIPGKLTTARFAPAIPVHAPAYRTVDGGDFSDVDILTFVYRTDQDAAIEILSSALELDENPIASIMFISYGFSHVGPYLEMVHQVECRFRGEQLNYCAHIYVTNETSMLTGREWLGWPKQLADITFDPARFGYDGLITASLERPAGHLLAVGEFRAAARLDELPQLGVGRKVMNLKVIPSAVPGRAPSCLELVPTVMTPSAGEAWVGEGSVHLTGLSDFSPLHRLPVVENLGASLLRKVRLRLTAPTETYPL